jgi:ATP synthase protein I
LREIEPEIADTARRVIGFQLLISVLIACAFFIQGTWYAISALYGGLASVVIAWFMSRGFKRASQASLHNPGKSMAILYLGAAQRFVLVIVLLGIGLSVLDLTPVAIITGFAIAQISYVFSARGMQRS